MSDGRVYTVTGSAAEPARPVSLVEAGLKERSDLQEWVIAHPEILGPGILVVTAEFARWEAAGGERPLDRLDVLGLDSDGRLVVAELKRDRAPDTVEMQAIKYAAFVSRFTEEALVEQHLAHLKRRSPSDSLDADTARMALLEQAGGELDPEALRRPRIVLVAGSFPPAVTATAVWLQEMGLDISLQSVEAYRVASGEIIVSVTQLFPIADIEDFTVGPRHGETVKRIRRRRELSAVVRLVVSGEIPEGTALKLRPPGDVPPDDRVAIEAWIATGQGRDGARWHNDRRHPLEWPPDGERYRPTPLVRKILRDVGLDDRPISGSSWWVLPDGTTTLAQVAARITGGFDWAPLHAILSQLPPGRWTTYGDLAQTVGTGAVALGQHLASCIQCMHAWRVLGADGRARSGFKWSDPSRTESQEAALIEEGLAFPGGRADEARRMTSAEFSALAGDDAER